MKKLISLIIVVGIFITGQFSMARAISISSSRDCDDNAVMRCGALTTAELQQKYHGTGVVGIFNHFGISAQDINNIDSLAVPGQVTKSGNVIVNGRVVATDVVTAGRQNKPGSTLVMAGGVKFYERTPRVSFTSSPLAAFVIMKNGQATSGIIVPCGNAFRATPVVKKPAAPTPAPQPTPPTPVSPAPTVIVQQQQQQQQVSPPQVKAAVTPPPTPQKLADTGPGQVISLGILASIGASIGHYLYYRRQLS